MRFFIVLCVASVLLGAVLGCQKTESVKTSDNVAMGEIGGDQPDTAVLWVRGMGCPQCSYNVDMQLMKVAGVEKVKVDMGTGRVFVQLSPTHPPTSEQLSEAIKETGFTLVRIDMPRAKAASSS